MKTIASLVGIFFAVIILGAILSFCVASLLFYSTNLVVGETVEHMSWEQMASLFFVCGGVATIATTPFLVAHSIRYPHNGFARIITYTILTALAWLVIIPACLVVSQKFESIDLLKAKHPVLTTNYFRPNDGTLYYYTTVNSQTMTVNGVSFTLNDIDSATDSSKLLENGPQFQASIQPFSDVLVYDTLQISKFMEVAIPAFILSKQQAQDTFSKGFFPWLVFASWGLAAYATIGLRRLFQWRLLNFCTILLVFIGICILNLFYSLGWNGNLFDLITLPQWLLNCIIAAVCSCLGILLAIFRKDPNTEHVE